MYIDKAQMQNGQSWKNLDNLNEKFSDCKFVINKQKELGISIRLLKWVQNFYRNMGSFKNSY